MITIYSMEKCGYCASAKAALTIKNIDFKEVRVPHDMPVAEFVSNFPNCKSFPLIFDDFTLVGGFKELQTYLLSKELGGTSL